MQWRLSEGQGKAIYRLGVTDSGEQVGLPVVELDASIETVKKMATQLKADVHLVSRKQGVQGETAELLVEKRCESHKRIGYWFFFLFSLHFYDLTARVGYKKTVYLAKSASLWWAM